MAPSVEETIRLYLEAAARRRRQTLTPEQARAKLVSAGIIKPDKRHAKKHATVKAG